ncbi:uncharacterized protein Z519_02352 [Cladophialophora bantiana CBS 173.52]|uniref:Uncharacterized protein n=1 Tax=Cladophialophora bantiana (strain ATCC 10958 / CBS 173.52 / CDC B-1940 / NIH 8579) TaxID=1442370 RepID=A0A0D2F432_CLAB1|nr:uncharacterized protein Z519_02352 [Cladophialophora bantiana CBS 173.52]KIW96961.1 hypothetical protein Z519_02352 [Cladophialophora bantiana CBS 173.52]
MPTPTLDGMGWQDSGFVLVLEIRIDGLPGAFHTIHNLTFHNDWEGLTDDEVYGDPDVLTLFESGP